MGGGDEGVGWGVGGEVGGGGGNEDVGSGHGACGGR